MSDFESLKNLMPHALKAYKLTRQARAAEVCQRFRRLAPEYFSEDAALHVVPKSFKGGTLYVAVESSAWAQQVHLKRHDLIMKMNLEMEKEVVNDIRTAVEPLSP